MKVALFIPCFIDQFYPKAAIATLELLEKLGCEVVYPTGQTCCGQPMANTGCEQDAIPAYHHFVDIFEDYEYIVSPSGSCTHHVRHHYDIIEQTQGVKHVRQRTMELSEFLIKILRIEKLDAYFPHKVGVHQGCHGLRGLRIGQSSERMAPDFSYVHTLLNMVEGLELITLDKKDECCGFGGTFAVTQEAVSVKMGKDRVNDHLRNGAEIITSADMSCLMHMEGVYKRQKQPLRIMHFAEILNSCK